MQSQAVLPCTLALLAACSACAPNLSTDEGVRRAASSELGAQLDQEACVQRFGELPEVILVGGFANDRGCELLGGFVGGTWVGHDGDIGRAVLRHLGWSEASAARRQQLALTYLRNVAYVWDGGVLDSPGEGFDQPGAPAFEPPRTTAAPGGGVRIVAWVSRPSGGMMRATTHDYDRVQHDFDGSGRLTTSVLARARIPIPGIEVEQPPQ